MKRKTIDDFFKTATEGRSQKTPRTVKEPNINLSLGIPGLTLVSDFVTPQEELALLAYLDACQWRTDLSRRVIHFGGTYCLMPPRSATPEERKAIESTILTADPIPVALEFVIERLIRDGVYEQGNEPRYCIVNEYKDNHGISAHIENFKFISPVCGLTLGDGDWMRFHELVKPDDGSVRSGQAAKAKRTGKKLDIWMPPRSLLIMSGHSRDRWQHEILRSRKDRVGEHWRRVSLTFRAEKHKK